MAEKQKFIHQTEHTFDSLDKLNNFLKNADYTKSTRNSQPCNNCAQRDNPHKVRIGYAYCKQRACQNKKRCIKYSYCDINPEKIKLFLSTLHLENTNKQPQGSRFGGGFSPDTGAILESPCSIISEDLCPNQPDISELTSGLKQVSIGVTHDRMVKASDGSITNLITGIYYRVQKNEDFRFLYGPKHGNSILQSHPKNDPEASNNFLWTLVSEGDANLNFYRLKKKGDGRVLDGFESSSDIEQRPDDTNNHSHRHWQLVPCSDLTGYFRIQKKGNGKVIDGWNKISLINQQTDDEAKHTNRLWRFLPDCKFYANVTEFEYEPTKAFESLRNAADAIRQWSANGQDEKIIRNRVIENNRDQSVEYEETFETDQHTSFEWRIDESNATQLSENFVINIQFTPPAQLEGLGFGPGYNFAYMDQTHIKTNEPYEKSNVERTSRKVSFKAKPRSKNVITELFRNETVEVKFKAKVSLIVKADQLGAARMSTLEPSLAKILLENEGYSTGTLMTQDGKLYSEITGMFKVKRPLIFLTLNEFDEPVQPIGMTTFTGANQPEALELPNDFDLTSEFNLDTLLLRS